MSARTIVTLGLVALALVVALAGVWVDSETALTVALGIAVGALIAHLWDWRDER